MSTFFIPENLAVSDSGFLFLPNTGETFSLNEMGRVIFRMLQQKRSEEEIIAEICSEYQVDRSIVSRDVDDFVSQLKNYSLIKVQ
ncbi:MAG: PqqD family protein [Ignavibacteriaceae bacterium]|nr:PqqD family protein [Ignavibacteriaceae bacterium]